jgi:hypothetical protein
MIDQEVSKTNSKIALGLVRSQPVKCRRFDKHPFLDELGGYWLLFFLHVSVNSNEVFDIDV